MREHIPKKVREQVKAKFNGHCGYCGEKPDKLQIDHIHPVCYGHWLEREGKSVHDLG